MKFKLESKLKGEISITSYAYDITQMLETEEELKSLSMRVKEDSEKAGLKLKIQRTKIMTSGPITSWQMWGKSGSSGRFYILGPQNHCMMTAAMKLMDACSLEKKLLQTQTAH